MSRSIDHDHERFLCLKYSKVYGEAEAHLVNDLIDATPALARFRHVLTIPAFDETSEFLQRIKHAFSECLLILVINQSDDTPNRRNQALWQAALGSGEIAWQRENLCFLLWPAGSALLVVDRFSRSRSIPKNEGVGCARKIACDLALSLKAHGMIATQWIHTSDADALLPLDYFTQTADLKGYSAALYNFEHQCGDDAVGRATALYEQYLDYYVAGLRWAGSPYARHTIGSCLAIDASRYAKVRGFPKRAGGEDFYLVNKLSKLAPVAQCAGAAIGLEARKSSRVPFGTGPAVERIAELAQADDDYLSYDPRVFICLRDLLGHLSILPNYFGTVETAQAWEHAISSWSEQMPRQCHGAWQQLKPERLYSHLRKQCKTSAQAERHIQHWFDAFRTLKFIHHLQDAGIRPIPLGRALDEARRQLPGFTLGRAARKTGA